MSKIINLPSGATATIKDARELKQKDRDRLFIDDDNASAMKIGQHITKTLISLIVEEWSFDLVPPSVKIDSLGELSIADYDALAEEAEKAMPLMFPKLQEASDDPKAPAAK